MAMRQVAAVSENIADVIRIVSPGLSGQHKYNKYE